LYKYPFHLLKTWNSVEEKIEPPFSDDSDSEEELSRLIAGEGLNSGARDVDAEMLREER
jgi:hypothetical protein